MFNLWTFFKFVHFKKYQSICSWVTLINNQKYNKTKKHDFANALFINRGCIFSTLWCIELKLDAVCLHHHILSRPRKNPRNHQNSNGLNGCDGNCIAFHGNYNGLWWSLLLCCFIGRMWNKSQNTLRKNFKW